MKKDYISASYPYFYHDLWISIHLLAELCSLGDSLDLVPIAAFHGRGKRTGNWKNIFSVEWNGKSKHICFLALLVTKPWVLLSITFNVCFCMMYMPCYLFFLFNQCPNLNFKLFLFMVFLLRCLWCLSPCLLWQ